MHLQQRKFARDDIEGAGLAFVNRVNKLQDQFRARVMFPIYDQRGDAVGFGGRALGDEQPKYKNSPETPIYQKSRLLYGLNWAKGEIVGRGQVVICEGYTDVMAFALAGSPIAVATCGTALADDHFQILKNLARKVVLAYDSDAAGPERGGEVVRLGAALRDPARGGRPPGGQGPRRRVARRPRRAPAGARTGNPVPAVPARPRARGRRPRHARGPGPRRRGGRGDRRAAPERARARPVRHEARRRARHRRRPAARHGGAPAQGAGGGWPATRRVPARRPSSDVPPATRRPPMRVDRRELDVLLYAVHEPELVVDWLDDRLFVDPLTAAHSTRSLRATASTTRSHRPTARCSTCSSASRSRSRSRPTNRRRCARI